MNSEICIVGGGPAGLAGAIALTQSGREVTLLDCAVPPIDKACGEGLMPDALEALAKLGVNLSGVGTVLQGVRFLGAESSVESTFPNGTGRALRRVLLHELLVARAEHLGVRMFWGVKGVHTRRGRVSFQGGHVDTKLIVGADGQQSSVRQEAGLNRLAGEKRRFGFRKHYLAAAWSPYVEVYWGHQFQVYVTPAAVNQVCVALMSTVPQLRLDAALRMLPALSARLRHAPEVTPEKGSLSVSRKLRRVCSDGYALLGDASGSVDAIAGEGLCLAFRQSSALAAALEANDMRLYERNHREIAAVPLRMAALMLVLDSNPVLQRKSLAALAARPSIFGALVAAHVGHQPLCKLVSWQLLSFGLGVLCG